MPRPGVNVSSLFEWEPQGWGLRGDPFLWREMREATRESEWPDTSARFVELVSALFQDLTGHPVSAPEYFFVEKFAHGGMSSGYVDPSFWRDTAIPLLRRRYGRANSRSQDKS